MDWRGMFRRRRERSGRWCWGRFRMEVDFLPSGFGGAGDRIRGFFLPQPASWPGTPFAALRMTIVGGCACVALAVMVGCHGEPRAPGTVVVILESSPNNLDPRQGTDAQSEIGRAHG